MLKKVLKGTLAVFFATVFVISYSTDVFAAYPCKGGSASSTTPGNNSGYNGSGWSNNGVSGFFIQNLITYGLRRGVSNEPWHVSP